MAFKYGTYEFPPEVEVVGFDAGQIKPRSMVKSRAFSHGGVDMGDGYFEPRQVRLRVKIYGRYADHHKQLLDDFLYFINKTDLKLYPDDVRYVNVKRTSGISVMPLDAVNYQLASVVEVNFTCEDPFWYYESITHTKVITSSPTTFDIFNAGTGQSSPIITITAAATLSTIELKNQTDNVLFQYTDANFVIGDVLVVDCKAGTVKRNGTNSIRYFTGSYLRLLARANSMKYTGGNCTIQTAYDTAYIYG